MSSSQDSLSQVYIGFWTNWSRGSINGATITLARSDGTTLIAFIAFFVAWAGTCFWRIICFLIHYASSSPGQHDGLYHQQQAILRNASEPESGLRLLAMLYLSWRRRARRAFWRLFSLLVIALTCVVIGSLASLFSPRISEIGDEVLLVGSRCSAVGKYDDFPDKEAKYAYLVTQQIQRTTQIENAANYAQQCYSASAGKEAECDIFVQRRLPITADMNASCPFDSRVCKTQDQNLVLDTGYLDSHEHFGINAPPKDRFLYRRKISCAPLVTEGHKVFMNGSGTRLPGMAYNYQSNNNTRSTYFWDNATYNNVYNYELGVTAAFYGYGKIVSQNTQFIPIKELHMNRTDATIFIFWLSTNQVVFTNRTEDAWYNATVPTTYTNRYTDQNGRLISEENVTQYYGAEYASPLGCKLQDQFCNPNKPLETGCSDFGGWIDPVDRSIDAFDKDYEGALTRLGWFTWLLGDMVAFHRVVKTLGPRSLSSRYRLTDEQTQAGIATNQWMLDVRYWLEINLAAMQGAAVITATGAPTPEMKNTFSKKPNSTVEHVMCENQKIRSKDHTSFSVVGLGVTFGLGLLVVILSYLLDPIMTCLQRRRRIAEYKRLKWSTDGFLQLQRLAYEGVGQGTWSCADGDVPITKKGETLAGLDLTDPSHPRIGSMRFQRGPTLGLLDKSTVYTRD